MGQDSAKAGAEFPGLAGAGEFGMIQRDGRDGGTERVPEDDGAVGVDTGFMSFLVCVLA